MVGDRYGANLVVMNIGDTYTTGPSQAAYVVNDLIRPASVIASHANEAATENGKVREGTRTAEFIRHANMPVHVPLSGQTIVFGGNGKCAGAC